MKKREGENSSLCFMVLYLVPSNKAEEYIPPPFKVVNILPGYTTGGFYISSNLEDPEKVNEFALLPAYTQYEGKRGFYYNPLNISKTLLPLQPADSYTSILKKIGDFFHFEASYNNRQVISLNLQPKLKKIPIKINYPFLVVKGNGIVFYRLNCISNFTFTSSDIEIPRESPLYEYPFKLKVLSGMWECNNRVSINEPVPILGKKLSVQFRSGMYGKRANSFRRERVKI
ncbi:MAG: hypothetical protein HZC10_00960 [Nitrospirae bacterium]|nr:hypothetical protein [Nitrospirota bacterium]